MPMGTTVSNVCYQTTMLFHTSQPFPEAAASTYLSKHSLECIHNENILALLFFLLMANVPVNNFQSCLDIYLSLFWLTSTKQWLTSLA